MQRKKKEKGGDGDGDGDGEEERRLEGWKHVQVRIECKVKDMR